MTDSFVTAWYPALFGFIAVVVWLVRLEAKVSTNARDVEKLEEEVESVEVHILKSIDDMKKDMMETKITVVKAMERVEHMNKSVLAIKAKDFGEYLDRNE